MSIAFAASATTTGTGRYITLTVPSSTAEGDLLLVFIGGNAQYPCASLAGWNKLDAQAFSTFVSSSIFWRSAQSGDASSNVTFDAGSSATSQAYNGVMHRITGAESVALVLNCGTATANFVKTVNSPASNTRRDGAVALRTLVLRTSQNVSSSPPGSDVYSTTVAPPMFMRAEEIVTAGSVPATTWNWPNFDRGIASTVIIEPYASPTVGADAAIADTATTTGTGTSASFTIPASTEEGDLLLAYIVNSTSTLFDAKSGWTRTTQAASSFLSAALYWREAQAGDANSNVTFTVGGSVFYRGILMRISGWDSNYSPSIVTTSNTSAVSTIDSPARTSNTDNALALYICSTNALQQAIRSTPTDSKITYTSHAENGNESIFIAGLLVPSPTTIAAGTWVWGSTTQAIAATVMVDALPPPPPDPPVTDYYATLTDSEDNEFEVAIVWPGYDPGLGESPAMGFTLESTISYASGVTPRVFRGRIELSPDSPSTLAQIRALHQNWILYYSDPTDNIMYGGYPEKIKVVWEGDFIVNFSMVRTDVATIPFTFVEVIE